MTKLKTFLALALGGAFVTVVLTASAQPAQPGYATVVRVKGLASYSLDGGAHKSPLVAGKFLEPGATIYTGDDSMVDVVLGKSIDLPQPSSVPDRVSLAPDSSVRGLVSYRPSTEQNVVRLMPNTALVIDKLTTTSSSADTVSDTELDLKKGGLYASVKKLSPASQYLVKTPTGIAGVRGTQFSITLNPDGTIKDLSVYKTDNDNGLVLAVTMPDGTTQTYTIKDGQMWGPGDLSPVPISPYIKQLLHEIFISLRTHYLQLANFNPDHTQFSTSTDHP